MHHILYFLAILPFELLNMNATPKIMYKSGDHPNGVYVMESFFNSCSACNVNAPNVNALAQEFAEDSRVQVLDIGIDSSNGAYESWISKHKPNHPVLKDEGMVLTRKLGTRLYPTAYVVDCHGNVAYSHVGTWDTETQAAIREKVKEVLGTQSCDVPVYPPIAY